jgi:hypothetical protein
MGVTAGFREGRAVFKNNDIAQVRTVTETSLFYMTAGECAVTETVGVAFHEALAFLFTSD